MENLMNTMICWRIATSSFIYALEEMFMYASKFYNSFTAIFVVYTVRYVQLSEKQIA